MEGYQVSQLQPLKLYYIFHDITCSLTKITFRWQVMNSLWMITDSELDIKKTLKLLPSFICQVQSLMDISLAREAPPGSLTISNFRAVELPGCRNSFHVPLNVKGNFSSREAVTTWYLVNQVNKFRRSLLCFIWSC